MDGHEALPGGEGGRQIRLSVAAGVAVTAGVAITVTVVVTHSSNMAVVSYADPLQTVQTLNHTRTILLDRIKLQKKRK